MNEKDPLTFHCDVNGNAKWEFVDIHGNVKECSGDQMLEFSDETEHVILRKTTSSEIPSEFSLSPAFPNPFNPVTTFKYDLPIQSLVSLRIYDLLGHEIKELVNYTQDSGMKSVSWNGKDQFGHQVGAGIYVYKLKAGTYIQARKIALIK